MTKKENVHLSYRNDNNTIVNATKEEKNENKNNKMNK